MYCSLIIVKDPLKIEPERMLYDFKDAKCMDDWQVFTDESFGGFSKATFTHQDVLNSQK